MKELDKIGPELSNFKKENPFRIPDGYFEHFSVRLSDKIHAEREISGRQKQVLVLRPYLAAAVILIVVMVTGTYFLGNHQSKKAEKRFYTEVSREIDKELYYISEETILEVMNTDVQGDFNGPTVSSEEVMDYLLNQDLNEDELVNSL
jgi:hypothetical protein